jgi:hypothetical protein
MQAFVVAYQGAWASREPGAMRALSHPDGVLHHPGSTRDPSPPVPAERVRSTTRCG